MQHSKPGELALSRHCTDPKKPMISFAYAALIGCIPQVKPPVTATNADAGAKIPATDNFGEPFAASIPVDVRRFFVLAALSAIVLLAGCTNIIPDNAQASHEQRAVEEMMMFRDLTETMLVSPQITIDDVAVAKAAGVTLIINNRPDGEVPDQPAGDDIAAAAKAAGLDYVAIPVTHAGFSAGQLDALDAALARLDDKGGKVLAFCRSGTRSTLLWSLAQARKGMSVGEIARIAGNAGYDITPIRPMLDTLAGQVSPDS